MRSPKIWLPAFLVLFIFYQAPEGIGARWLQQPALAAGLMLAFLPVAWAVARWLGLSMGKAYALEWNRRAARLLMAGVLAALVVKAVAIGLGLRWGVYVSATGEKETISASAAAASLGWLALSTFVPSLAEDIVTRGFWARIPSWRWTPLTFVLFTSVLYVANHVYRLANGPGEWLMLLCFGLAYATAIWRSGSLWAAVGLHWGWNLAGPALGMAWPYDVEQADSARLLSAAAHLILLAILFLIPARTATRPP